MLHTNVKIMLSQSPINLSMTVQDAHPDIVMQYKATKYIVRERAMQQSHIIYSQLLLTSSFTLTHSALSRSKAMLQITTLCTRRQQQPMGTVLVMLTPESLHAWQCNADCVSLLQVPFGSSAQVAECESLSQVSFGKLGYRETCKVKGNARDK